jgi:hypothetical protein
VLKSEVPPLNEAVQFAPGTALANSTVLSASDGLLEKEVSKSDVRPLNKPVQETLYPSLDDVKKQIRIFAQHRGTYGNKADFDAFKRLVEAGGLCESTSPTLIGGVNKGGATLELLRVCPNLKVIGFEIQAQELDVAKAKLKNYANVELHNYGWGEFDLSNLTISGQTPNPKP